MDSACCILDKAARKSPNSPSISCVSAQTYGCCLTSYSVTISMGSYMWNKNLSRRDQMSRSSDQDLKVRCMTLLIK